MTIYDKMSTSVKLYLKNYKILDIFIYIYIKC